MTFDEKVSLIFRLVNEDYANILSPEGAGVYMRLVWMRQEMLDSKVYKNNPSISYDYILSNVKISREDLDTHIKILEALGLVSMLSRKAAVYINNPKSLNYDERVKLIEDLAEKGIIDPSQKHVHIDGIHIHEEKKKQRKISSMEPKDYDFGSATIRNPDSSAGLVKYYYDKLSQEFGGHFTSRNIAREASLIKALMGKWNDSPDATRQMFDYMIKKAKEKGRFQDVSSMSLYGSMRNNVYYYLFGQKLQAPKPLSVQEEKMSNMKVLYDIYLDNGMSHEEAFKELGSAFGEETLKQFEAGINGKQIPIHQGTM